MRLTRSRHSASPAQQVYGAPTVPRHQAGCWDTAVNQTGAWDADILPAASAARPSEGMSHPPLPGSPSIKWGETYSSLTWLLDSPGGSDSKEFASDAGNWNSVPVSGRSPGEGDGSPLQYSCLESPMDRGAWQDTVLGITKSWTQLSDYRTHVTIKKVQAR